MHDFISKQPTKLLLQAPFFSLPSTDRLFLTIHANTFLLGEDRYLTHLLALSPSRSPLTSQTHHRLLYHRNKPRISISPYALCKTEAVPTFPTLLAQRRRWLLGFLANEACLLTDPAMWRRHPLLCLLRITQDSLRTNSLLFLVVLLGLVLGGGAASGAGRRNGVDEGKNEQQVPSWFLLCLGVAGNWVLLVVWGGWMLGRWKVVLYPVLFAVSSVRFPFFSHRVRYRLAENEREGGGVTCISRVNIR